MSRRDARTIALKSLFALDFDQEKTEQTAAETVASLATEEEFAKVGKKDRAYALALVEGTEKNQAAIDAELESLSGNWKVERMSAIDRNLLRIAAYEILYAPEPVPAAVAINEAVELAKAYGGDDSPSFINGLLGPLVKKHGA